MFTVCFLSSAMRCQPLSRALNLFEVTTNVGIYRLDTISNHNRRCRCHCILEQKSAHNKVNQCSKV
ncbi:hypothetical protein EAY19_23470 [Vibrio anguillarum]|nr:hypothetical protein [Vibrio anguillarum]MBF4364610.1 hypothetical protein [Vibrio anguillarum]